MRSATPLTASTLPRRHRSGRISRAGLVLLIAIAGMALLYLQMKQQDAPQAAAKGTTLTVHCAASLKVPVEAIAKRYEQEHGVRVQLQFGASQTLLAGIEVARQGDLYLPADDSYFAGATAKGLVSTTIPLATQTAMLVVAKGNPKGVHGLADLQRSDVKVAVSNPAAVAIGMLVQKAMGDAAWKLLADKAVVTTATVTEAANALKAGSADATFIWDAMLRQYPDTEVVPVKELEPVKANVAVGLLTCSHNNTSAMRFARYLAASDAGLPVFKAQGFAVVEGDPWAETPELKLYAGSMLRPAIENTITDFEQREGVRVTRVYNGCGILVGQMKAGAMPDAYFACDSEFMNQVQPSFEERDDISQNQLVILVAKGNPKGIADLKDLSKPGLRLGIGHEKQCAMGWLTQRTFTEAGLTDQVMKNVTVQTPTGDMLVNQMQAGSLDAAVTYLSNAVGAGDKLDAVRIQGIKCATATQPFAIARNSPYKQLMKRLHDLLRTTESRQRFETNGFGWK